MRKYRCIALCAVALIAGCVRVKPPEPPEPPESYANYKKQERIQNENLKARMEREDREWDKRIQEEVSPAKPFCYKSELPYYPFHYIYYKPGTTVAQAKKDSEKILMDTYQNTPGYKLNMPGYYGAMYELKMQELGYIGVNHPFLPEGYIIQKGINWVAGCRAR